MRCTSSTALPIAASRLSINEGTGDPDDPCAYRLLLTFWLLYATVISFFSPKIIDAQRSALMVLTTIAYTLGSICRVYSAFIIFGMATQNSRVREVL